MILTSCDHQPIKQEPKHGVKEQEEDEKEDSSAGKELIL
jgi:hypothetical protein